MRITEGLNRVARNQWVVPNSEDVPQMTVNARDLRMRGWNTDDDFDFLMEWGNPNLIVVV